MTIVCDGYTLHSTPRRLLSYASPREAMTAMVLSSLILLIVRGLGVSGVLMIRTLFAGCTADLNFRKETCMRFGIASYDM